MLESFSPRGLGVGGPNRFKYRASISISISHLLSDTEGMQPKYISAHMQRQHAELRNAQQAEY